jgi:hypothetical protein
MRDVADDNDLQILEASLVPSDCKQIKQSLCGVRDVCFSGIQNTNVRLHMAGYVGWYTLSCVTDHEHIDFHCLQRIYRVKNALALDSRRRIYVKIQDFGTQSLCGQLE